MTVKLVHSNDELEEKEQDKAETNITGPAFCIQCNHTWIAVVPTGIVQLECPSCHTMKGLFRYPSHVGIDEDFRECSCGNSLFYLTKEGHLCPNCGNYQIY